MHTTTSQPTRQPASTHSLSPSSLVNHPHQNGVAVAFIFFHHQHQHHCRHCRSLSYFYLSLVVCYSNFFCSGNVRCVCVCVSFGWPREIEFFMGIHFFPYSACSKEYINAGFISGQTEVVRRRSLSAFVFSRFILHGSIFVLAFSSHLCFCMLVCVIQNRFLLICHRFYSFKIRKNIDKNIKNNIVCVGGQLNENSSE